MTVTWTHAHSANAHNLVIVECNFNVYSADTSACNQNPNNLDMPGGPYIPGDQNANGSSVIQFTSGTVGDGTCNSDEVCGVVLANVTTQEPIAGPFPIAVTP